MTTLVFEVLEQGMPAAPAKVLTLPDGRAIWAHIEALALHMVGREGAIIRVKNANDETIARVGVATALVSIERCPCDDCPIKKALKHFVATGHHSALEPNLHVECLARKAALAA
jgi:hypothetical protein